MSLIIRDTISLTTASGVSKIQLCIGDITKLPKQEEADVLVVSAFPGDYSPTPSSLIGALAINLGISVRNLSRDKEEDLRRQYFCWWSRPLPEEHSFRRILCFEGGFGSRGSTPPKVVGAVFRCLVPILSGKDSKGGSVIMPLLASGDQGYSKRLMLRLIMDSAIHWIKAGLELKTLKIVVFSRHPDRHDKSHEPPFECFQEMKDQYGDKELTYETEIIYDVYMSHSPKDHDSALQIAKFLRIQKKLRVFQDFQELNDNESWQGEIFDIMGKCARVIVLLSPGYMETESCIEQYNMALCINRRSHGTVLAPFYITSIDYMPTYMSLIQYEDCRPNDKEKLQIASNNVADSLEKTQEEVSSNVPTMTNKASGYDVFISYSHQNKTHANKVLETLKSLAPDLRIFIDTAGLNTGTSWQQILYNALDASRSTIALLSPHYIKSKVCYEEFCLSHAVFVDKDRCMDIVSLLVEPVQQLPLWCQQPLPVDCASLHVDTDEVVSSVCADLVKRLNGADKTTDDFLTQRVRDLKKGNLTLELSMDNYRRSCFVLRSGVLKTPVDFTSGRGDKESMIASHASDVVMSVDGHHVGLDPESSQATSSNPTSEQVTSSRSATCDVALSYAEGDKRAAVILKQLLLEKVPSLKISEPKAGDFSRVQSLDVARFIIPLLSPAFLASSELVEELNIAIFRNRSASRRILFPIQIAAYPPKPSYVHLVPCEFSSSDYKWAHRIVDQKLEEKVSLLAQRNDMDVDEAFCLKTAARVISEQLLEESKPVLNPVNRVLLNVHVIEEEWKQIKMALQQEERLESWKRTFGIEINSTEGDFKPARIIGQDDVVPDVETQLIIGKENESNGVELHLEDLSNNVENSTAGTDNQDQSQKLTNDETQVTIGDEHESNGMELQLKDLTNNVENSTAGTDNQDQSQKLTNDETQVTVGDEHESNGMELQLKDLTNNGENSSVATDNQDQSQKLTNDDSLENESIMVEESVRFQDELTDKHQAADAADNQPRSREHEGQTGTKGSKSCSLL